MKNIELKVQVDELEGLREKLGGMGAEKTSILRQVDMYFNTKKGRLKLREINQKNYELIYYERPDESESKVSSYEVISFNADGVSKIKDVLCKTNGVKVIVKKKRELWLYKHTRVHLDQVEGLGEYLELETVVRGVSMGEAGSEHNDVVNMLKLNQYQKCRVSYSDLLLER